MSATDAVLAADAAFFAALLAADAGRLEQLLSDDFLIVDVNQGAVTQRATFMGFVASGAARFETIETNAADSVVRIYGDAAIVVGATSMRFRLEDGTSFAARSRYTHVFIRGSSEVWLLASAQGTPIAA
ncbi:MAG TPA: nuclear transport factor 2 family protein [Pseudomonadales bacterium]|nr:nuclear transport factor 2 family protein [Pseudomonadales bacterium]